MNSDYVYAIINAIAHNSKKTEKVKLLQGMIADKDEMKQVLQYTYTPFKRYGFRKLPEILRGVGTNRFSPTTWRLLDLLAEGKMRGKHAKETVHKYVRCLSPNSADLFKRILLKDLRAGINVKLINSVFPYLIPEHNVMLAEEYDPKRVTLPAYISPKYNGNRGTLDGKSVYGRKGNTYRGLGHICRDVRSAGYIGRIDGELIVPGVPFNKASGMIRSGNQVLGAVLMAFDLPDHPGTYIERQTELETLCQKFTYVRRVPHYSCGTTYTIMERHRSFVEQGFEGSVVKTPGALYQVGYSYDWMKIVDEKSMDLEVLGIYHTPKRTNLNQIGGVWVRAVRGKKLTKVGGGFSNPQLEKYFLDPKQAIGRTARILYKSLTADGALQHPRFDRWRYSK